MLQQVLGVSDDKQRLEWGIRMYVVSRQLERVGDNAVDIGEQVAFLVTGEFHEFTDASHPEIEHPELLERGGSPLEDHNPTPGTHPQQVSKQSEPLLAARGGGGAGGARPLLLGTGQTLTIPLGSMTYLRAAPLSKSW
jgi:hypothetical protein